MSETPDENVIVPSLDRADILMPPLEIKVSSLDRRFSLDGLALYDQAKIHLGEEHMINKLGRKRLAVAYIVALVRFYRTGVTDGNLCIFIQENPDLAKFVSDHVHQKMAEIEANLRSRVGKSVLTRAQTVLENGSFTHEEDLRGISATNIAQHFEYKGEPQCSAIFHADEELSSPEARGNFKEGLLTGTKRLLAAEGEGRNFGHVTAQGRNDQKKPSTGVLSAVIDVPSALLAGSGALPRIDVTLTFRDSFAAILRQALSPNVIFK